MMKRYFLEKGQKLHIVEEKFSKFIQQILMPQKVLLQSKNRKNFGTNSFS